MEMDERKKMEEFVAREIGEAARFVRAEEGFIEEANWENVTGHCLIEAARACILADLLGLDAELKKDLVLAALLHDGHKRQEIEAIQEEMKRGGSGRAASLAVTQKYLEELAAKGVPKRVIELISFAGGMPEALFAVKNILDKAVTSDDDLAALIVNYADAYTRNDDWAEPATPNLNDLDRRAEKNKNNPNYAKINEEVADILRGHLFFGGLNNFEAMVTLGREIEKTVSRFIKAKSGREIEPLKIPETVDGLIREKITTAA